MFTFPVPKVTAKFTPHIHLANSTGLNQRQIREAHFLIENYLMDIENAWHSHFST